MFTGIIEEVGVVKSIRMGAQSAVITIQAEKVMEDIHVGDSIATNGVCLTVTSFDKNSYSVDVMHETLRRTNLGTLKSGSRVNLERAMAADGRFGGHIVAGHVDDPGTITSMEKDDNAIWITIRTTPAVLKYIVEKGSIAIDGISLTVARVDDKSFAVSVIPHTGANTTLLEKKPGDTVNLETDMVGKYVEKLLRYEESKEKPQSGITMDFLKSHGF
ncbi:MAG TPA: riboflavin synthase [Candidatus Anaerobutyricum faecale]|uniref:riboflavin synthase n=1 Tax=Eubacterium sp. An11 TaxID=1965542 RepID=UPI000B39F0BB|nr:riboflavin synthase [Eubacterium sp. An11]OUQ68629.1 riboflavin synthase [Eubacterium sp. An11]HJC32664.1 riboflavin synthase [Candidatus Anaerobutyricum faecale]